MPRHAFAKSLSTERLVALWQHIYFRSAPEKPSWRLRNWLTIFSASYVNRCSELAQISSTFTFWITYDPVDEFHGQKLNFKYTSWNTPHWILYFWACNYSFANPDKGGQWLFSTDWWVRLTIGCHQAKMRRTNTGFYRRPAKSWSVAS